MRENWAQDAGFDSCKEQRKYWVENPPPEGFCWSIETAVAEEKTRKRRLKMEQVKPTKRRK
jgi:hypothetical protein